jgi:hypothetical protein
MRAADVAHVSHAQQPQGLSWGLLCAAVGHGDLGLRGAAELSSACQHIGCTAWWNASARARGGIRVRSACCLLRENNTRPVHAPQPLERQPRLLLPVQGARRYTYLRAGAEGGPGGAPQPGARARWAAGPALATLAHSGGAGLRAIRAAWLARPANVATAPAKQGTGELGTGQRRCPPRPVGQRRGDPYKTRGEARG